MRTSTIRVVVTALLATMLNTAIWLSPPRASAADCAKQGNYVKAESCDKKLAWAYNPATHSFDSTQRRTSAGDPTGDRYSYDKFNVCDGSQDTVSCGAAALTCPPLTAGGARGYRVGVVRWLLLPDGTKAPGAGELSTACDYPTKSIPRQDIDALARQQIEKVVTKPTITVTPPGGKTLVNIPTIFSAPDPRPVTLSITTPVPGSITAIPEYTWDFGDGLAGVGPGTPYDASVDPVESPDSYLYAVYVSGGPKHITATLTWHVIFALEGITPVDLAPIVFTSNADIRAMTAKSRLVVR